VTKSTSGNRCTKQPKRSKQVRKREKLERHKLATSHNLLQPHTKARKNFSIVEAIVFCCT